ncbi:40S ribosomal protein S10-3 [Sesamum angolense]|uniref:40S ribosomal protein S10-3 n=1 Tax=Sesamum angolense TaxID=2727404 RepID=A0AAE1VZX6_9LAMI|nr:40S ribosomal protein S10-3 [Sesamum angolense]
MTSPGIWPPPFPKGVAARFAPSKGVGPHKYWITTQNTNLIDHSREEQERDLQVLFQEGVCYAKKDFNLAKHPEIDVPNLQVIKLMQSFKSKEYVRETFAWMHYYWYLTNDGIEFLRTYLNLPSEIVPATLKKSAKPLGRPMGGPPGDRPRWFRMYDNVDTSNAFGNLFDSYTFTGDNGTLMLMFSSTTMHKDVSCF